MRYFMGVESDKPENPASILGEFRAAAEQAFSGLGLDFAETKDQILIACPSRVVRDQLRSFVKTHEGVREAVTPAPTNFCPYI